MWSEEAAQELSVFGQDKSEVSSWISNILQGTKQSYSSLVSGISFLFFLQKVA